MTKQTIFPGSSRQEGGNHPMISLILLLALVFAGAAVFGTGSVFIALLVSADTTTGIGDMESLLSGSSSSTSFIKIVQAGFSIGMFILPAVLLGILERRKHRYLNFNAPVNSTLWLIIIGIMFFSAPIFEQSIKLNEQMQLPEVFSDLESWMKAKEVELKQFTYLLLSEGTYWGLFINLLVIAVIPAIGEEFLFRGCVQNILIRWLKNPHVSIWLTAIIFSAIHLQFYGFLPRMLLGALFGYLLLWGKNIWLPVLAHFINNATVVISAFYLTRQGKSLDELDFGEQIPTYFYFISFVLTAVLLFQYYKTSLAGKTRYDGKGLD